MLDCLFDDDDADSMTSTETVRIFRAITQRWPKYTCTGQEQDKSLGVSGKCTFARNFSRLACEAASPPQTHHDE